MNTTTTENIAETGKSLAKARTVTPGKRRMAREASNLETAEAAGGPAKPSSNATLARATSKIAMVIALLEREQGATLAEMVEATGWLPHTTRAALTGLKKKRYTLTKDKCGDMTCYHIVKAA